MTYVTSIGLDVHARSVSTCAFDPFTGEVAQRTFGTDAAEIAGWILGFEEPKAVYGSGPTGFALCRELRAPGVDASWAPSRGCRGPRPRGGASAGSRRPAPTRRGSASRPPSAPAARRRPAAASPRPATRRPGAPSSRPRGTSIPARPSRRRRRRATRCPRRSRADRKSVV